MKSPFSFIVSPINDRRYDNVKKIGDVDFITSASEEDHKASNRFATVHATPINYEGEIQVTLSSGKIALSRGFTHLPSWQLNLAFFVGTLPVLGSTLPASLYALYLINV